jgi:predicted house-cleaning noncanonical NTP pyrophosphatase (MazG superfamily)
VTGKLIRDRIPELFGWDGVCILADTEFRSALRAKLSEEVSEYLAAEAPAERLAELADVLEVLHALAAQDGHSPEALEVARVAKHAERGGFEARLWWQG